MLVGQRKGYNYHQKLIKSDPELFLWITQEHYFDDNQGNG